MENTYFISLVSPYSRNVNGEVRGAQKIYFCDTGLLNYLGKISDGAIFENAVYNNLKTKGKINYYQKYKGSEIDFILDEKIAIEVKQKAYYQDVNKLKRIVDKLNLTQRSCKQMVFYVN